jgi:hypothetical protein
MAKTRTKKSTAAAKDATPEATARDEYIAALIAEASLTDIETQHVMVAVSDGHPIEDVIAATLAARDAAAGLKFKIVEVDDPDFINLYGGAFKAVCKDGWESEVRTTSERAESSAEAHRDEVRAAAFAEQVG